MNLQDYFSSLRQAISNTIADTIARSESAAAGFSGDSAPLFAVLERYSRSGKMLRGILACLGCELFQPETGNKGDPAPYTLSLASALELFQAGLLVHDDIMDKDEMRRGMPTMHKLFERAEADRLHAQGEDSLKTIDSKGLGEAMGICAGDIFYFVAWNTITGFGPELGSLFSRELVDVCLAQIKDVRLGILPEFPGIEEVIEVYAYKTARYTITLPLCAGAILAGRSDAVPALEKLGLNLGILFQLQDDYLGLFGNEEELGKPTGSDIREGKKTPFMILLAEALSGAEKRRFLEIFGHRSITQEDIVYVRGLIRSLGIDARSARHRGRIRQESRRFPCRVFRAIQGDLNKEKLDLLKQFIAYSLSRTF